MTKTGAWRRRLVAADGRTVLVAMDHATFGAVGPADPRGVIAAAGGAGADGFLLSWDIARDIPPLSPRRGVILRVDGLTQGGGVALQHSVEDAVTVGADAVCAMGVGGCGADVLVTLRQVSARAGMPLMLEIPGEEWQPEALAAAVRAAVALGADLIKLPFIGPAESFAAIAARSPVPLVILGGGRVDAEVLLHRVAAALASGAAGVAVGRNVWTHPRPELLVRALVDVVHGGEDPVRALGLPDRQPP